MENAAADHVLDDMDSVSQKDNKNYHGVANEDPVPSVEPRRAPQQELPQIMNMATDAGVHPLGHLDPIGVASNWRAFAVCGLWALRTLAW